MYCSNCGTQLTDDANFCLKCGKPQKPNVQADETNWDTCEIVSEKVADGGILSGYRYKFWGKAIGSSGQYTAGESKVFTGYYGGSYSYPDKDNNENRGALDSLVNWLVKEGWESTGNRGTEWWSLRFRRKAVVRPIGVGDKDWEICDVGLRNPWNSGFFSKRKFGAFLSGKVDEKGNPKLISESSPFKGDPRSDLSKNSSEIVNAYNDFIEQLKKDGWEQIDFVGENWTRKRFRRKIK